MFRLFGSPRSAMRTYIITVRRMISGELLK